MLPGNLNLSAVATLCAAPRSHGTVKACVAVGPRHHLAAITRADGIGRYFYPPADVGGTGIALGPLALPIAADQCRTASADS